jgi:WD40 repeat protein
MIVKKLALAASVALGFCAWPVMAGEMIGPGIISTGLQETSVAVTADGNTLFFMRSDLGESDDTIMVSHRHGQTWGSPDVASFSGRWHDSEPTLSPDGKRLYFVSNRPPREGAAPVTASMSGREFPGTNLWYVQAGANGGWGAPVHVDGALNDGSMIYNPTVAANGNIYFSAHRPDSGKAYQIYVARRAGDGYAAPELVPLGEVANNRMDPAIDPSERFIVFAGNEGDSLGRADVYIAFRKPDGSWDKPEHLGGDVNSKALENAPSLGRGFGELYLSSDRVADVAFPKKQDTAASLQARLSGPANGSRNLWKFDIAGVLRAHGIDH